MANEKEPFVSKDDRPEVTIKPEQRIAELTVRDLGTLLGEHANLTLKRLKELKIEKYEQPKFEKFEKFEHPKWEKIEKFEKFEKWENLKREKIEKIEIDIFQKRDFEGPPDPTGPIGDPDPIGKLVAAVSRLEEHVATLDSQIAELRSKMK